MSSVLSGASEAVVCDIMSQNVISVPDTDTVQHAAKVIEELKISGAPVVNAYGHCIGVLSVKDYSRGIPCIELEPPLGPFTTVRDVMTTPAIYRRCRSRAPATKQIQGELWRIG